MGAGPKKNLKLRYITMAAAVAVLIAVWSGGWFYIRGLVDQRMTAGLDAINGSGNLIACKDREIGGFPFRFEVGCIGPVITDPSGLSVSLKRLEAVALVYNPWHVIFEADGPAAAGLPVQGNALSATWTSALSSMRVSGNGIRRADLSVKDFDLASNDIDFAGLKAKTVEFHARPVPETPDAIEAFGSADGLQVHQPGGLAAPVDTRVHLRLENGLALFSAAPLSALPHDDDGSLPIDLVWMSLKSEQTEITASGHLRLTADGTLSGKVDLKIKGIDQADDLLSRLFAAETGIPSTLKGTAIAFGVRETDPDGTPVTHLPLTIDGGALRVGIVPLGITIPPLEAGMS
ncbi:DUF2125 domain-containing protein [Roseibium aggregatum]|uniref:DUF2125 domain-containing protein n=1 Tax=Roseibium aggregatum TaxID=187304 RepID=A0A926NWB2_9HYPH|nr:DUF2125 domain-containing protein [Roseibium aggregatum]MBD1546479.1 DUF2125 domain-containing protein [Roseibium aggregatum]